MSQVGGVGVDEELLNVDHHFYTFLLIFLFLHVDERDIKLH